MTLRSRQAMLLCRAAAVALAIGMAGAAQAQAQTAASGDAVVAFNVPAGALQAALVQFADQSGVQLLYPTTLADKRSSPGVVGSVSVRVGLAQVLGGTGLTFRFIGGRTIEIIEVSASSGDGGERVLGAVRVEGAQSSGLAGATSMNGINGSRDVTATEGTGSYTTGAMTVGGKTVASIKDTPQSVSVLTAEQLKDQKITSFDQAMKQLPGVTVAQGVGNLANYGATFYSRGFEITNIQVDGGASLQTGTYYSPIIDMSVYDHVELLRGASSFSGYGTPGGAVNLVRKRALDHNQFVVDVLAGSWDKYRVSMDATGPLGLGGALRGRAVFTYQSNKFFYDVAKDKRLVFFATADLDITPTTTLTSGISYTWQKSVPNVFGLPRYENGEDIGLPRSTCFCALWNRADIVDRNIFVQIEQKIGNSWNFSVKLNRLNQEEDYYYGYVASPVEKTTGRTIYSFSNNKNRNQQDLAEATLNGSFRIFGRDQKVLLGANFARTDPPHAVEYYNIGYYSFYKSGNNFNVDYNPPVIDVNNPNSYSQNALFSPVSPTSLKSFERFEDSNINKSIYAEIDMELLSGLHILGGLRYTGILARKRAVGYCTPLNVAVGDPRCPTVGKIIGGGDLDRVSQTDFAWPPKVTMRYDVAKNLTIYGAYTDVYQPQYYYTTPSGDPVLPIRGNNMEGGAKLSFNDNRVNINFSFYRTERVDFAVSAVALGIPCPPGRGLAECQVNGSRGALRETSSGVDLEMTGEVLSGLQFSGSLTYNNNAKKGLDSITGSQQQGKPLVSRSPKYLYKLWINYTPSGKYENLSVNFGLNGQSSNFVAGSYCNQYSATERDPTTNAPICTGNVNYNFVQPGRIVLSGGLSYKINDNYEASFNVDNLLDKTYYETGGYAYGGNWYGAPRSITASLRAKW
jgi:outer-membrane receptor for ferric coprogen and ferric-rhodotorulic acid